MFVVVCRFFFVFFLEGVYVCELKEMDREEVERFNGEERSEVYREDG